MLARFFAASVALVSAGACSSFSTAAPVDVDGGHSYDAGFCKRQPASLFLCEDFDVGPLGFQWKETATYNGGFLEVVPSSRSAPNALLARSTNREQGWAYLVKELGRVTKRIVIAFDMRIETRGESYTEAGGLALIDPGSKRRYGVTFIIGPQGNLSVNEADETKQIANRPFSKTPLPGEWARFELDVDLTAATVRVRVDDAPAFTVDEKLAPPSVDGMTRFLNFGLDHFTVGGWRVAFDNLTCDVR